jgi:hypothetical protein
MVISGSGVGIGINPTQKFEVNAGQGARGGMALTGEYPYLRFNVSSSSANARNWALNATNAEAGDFALLQSNAKDGNPVTAGTSILGFSRSGDATFSGAATFGGAINTSENLLYSKRTSPANVNSGATTVFTITQKSGEFQSTYMVSIVGLYDSGGSNQNGFYTGFVTFFTDGAIAQANISAIHSNGWSASAAATTGGSFTITFTNGAATTMTNVRITALKINAT